MDAILLNQGSGIGAEGAVISQEIVIPRGRLYGDINNDGKIDLQDYQALNDHLTNVKKLSGEDLEVADVNKDGEVGQQDKTKLNNIIKGIETVSKEDALKVWSYNGNYFTYTITLDEPVQCSGEIIIKDIIELNNFSTAICDDKGKVVLYAKNLPTKDLKAIIQYSLGGSGEFAVLTQGVDIDTSVLVKQEQLKGITLYYSLSEISGALNENSNLVNIFNAMESPSRLVCEIKNGSASVYAFPSGVLTIEKINENRGAATYIYDGDRIATGSFS